MGWGLTGLFALGLVDGRAGSAPLLKLGRWYQTCWFARSGAPPPTLPPVVVILTDHLDDVADTELDPSLRARDKVVFFWRVVKQCSHKHLSAHGQAITRLKWSAQVFYKSETAKYSQPKI